MCTYTTFTGHRNCTVRYPCTIVVITNRLRRVVQKMNLWVNYTLYSTSWCVYSITRLDYRWTLPQFQCPTPTTQVFLNKKLCTVGYTVFKAGSHRLVRFKVGNFPPKYSYTYNYVYEPDEKTVKILYLFVNKYTI